MPVDGDPLPSEITSAIRAGGGELAATATWTARYGTGGLPEITGPQVLLAEATLTANAQPDGWHRTDERNWLFTDTSHGGRDQIITQLATAAGLPATPTASSTDTVESAPCLQHTWTLAGEVWRVNGCTYPHYPGMLAVGIGHDHTTTDPPPTVEPSCGQVATATAGRIDRVNVRLGHPAATGSTTTLRTSVHVTFNRHNDDPVAVLTAVAGPLAGWQPNPGDQSTGLTGLAGQWVVTALDATFTSDGRLTR